MSRETKSHNAATVWALAAVAIAAMLILAFVYVFRTLAHAPSKAVAQGREVLGDLAEVAEAFRAGTVETRFINYAAQVAGGQKLLVAELKQTEVYTRQDSGAVLWGTVELPDVVVSATVPVEYGFFLDLDGRWEFVLEDGTLWVDAPELVPTTPALDVSELRFDVRESSLLRDEESAVEALRTGLSELSRERARDHVSLVRETARRETEEFVTAWLAGAFDDAGSYRVEVRFADELPEVPDLAVRRD